jgi:hypothetical protein
MSLEEAQMEHSRLGGGSLIFGGTAFLVTFLDASLGLTTAPDLTRAAGFRDLPRAGTRAFACATTAIDGGVSSISMVLPREPTRPVGAS